MPKNTQSAKVGAAADDWRNHPFRRAVLRGLGVVLPPLLTIVIFLWVWSTIQNYVLQPIEAGARNVLTWYNDPIREDIPPQANVQLDKATGRVASFELDGEEYVPVAGDQFVPRDVYRAVSKNPGPSMPTTAEAIYHRYLNITVLRRSFVVPMFLSVFVLFLYLLGKFLAAGVGRFAWNTVERVIHRLPIIRNVYGSVKQVTDFVFSEQELEYTRVVAVEYPRKGIWSLGFVTGESMLDIRSAANEPVLSVLMPTSPMPATGFTVTVRKSETIDLNLTVDQAFQFIVSCGVVVPLSQQYQKVGQEIVAAVEAKLNEQPASEDTDGGGAELAGRADAGDTGRTLPSSNGSARAASGRKPTAEAAQGNRSDDNGSDED